jgi:uncharacterized protein YaiI (UPF0178 family)
MFSPQSQTHTPIRGMASAMRDLGAHLRETGESKGYNAAFTPKDRSAFLQTFDRLCHRAINNAKED